MNSTLNLLTGRVFCGTTKTGFSFATLICATVVSLNFAVESGYAAGTVVAWGDNASGQAGVPPSLTNITDVAGGSTGQYFLRWATLNRSANAFMPSFQITYQRFTAYSPANPPPFVSGTNYSITHDTNGEPIATNITYLYTTNYIISPYPPTTYAGDVTVGSLRLVANADVQPSSITLRGTYIPRYIRQLRLHYRANWPCAVSLESTNAGEQLFGWSLTQTNDGAGGQWATLTSSNPLDLTMSIPFADFGPLLTFKAFP